MGRTHKNGRFLDSQERGRQGPAGIVEARVASPPAGAEGCGGPPNPGMLDLGLRAYRV